MANEIRNIVRVFSKRSYIWLLFICLSLYWLVPVPFKPIRMTNGHVYVDASELWNNKDFCAGIERELTTHSEWHFNWCNRIWISPFLARNKSLIWNYTNKALYLPDQDFRSKYPIEGIADFYFKDRITNGAGFPVLDVYENVTLGRTLLVLSESASDKCVAYYVLSSKTFEEAILPRSSGFFWSQTKGIVKTGCLIGVLPDDIFEGRVGDYCSGHR